MVKKFMQLPGSRISAVIPSGSKMLGWYKASLDDVAHASLAVSSAAPGRSHLEISSKCTPREVSQSAPCSSQTHLTAWASGVLLVV
jgi:hypothetical protein